MNTRLKEIRTALKLTQSELANKLNMSRITIAQMENGSRNITDRTIKDICREFNVNYDWFYNGNGEMFIEDDSSTIKAIENIMSGDDDFYKNIVKMIVKLDHDDIKTLRKMAEMM
ncbi:MAG: helix-turn-helix domain-containing protein, partial [Coprobacillus sp.]